MPKIDECDFLDVLFKGEIVTWHLSNIDIVKECKK